MNKKFDCVEMKHKAARKISRRLSKMTREEELQYWHQKIKKYRSQQSANKRLVGA